MCCKALAGVRFCEFWAALPRITAKLSGMPNWDQVTHEPPLQAGRDGWLVNGDEQLLVRFSNARSTAHGQWVILSTYRWVRPHPPEPQSQRRMLQHNAIEAWQNMQKVGWRRCRPPVR